MLAISRAKSLGSSSLTPISVRLPKTHPLAELSLASNSILWKSDVLRNSRFNPNQLSKCSCISPSFAVLNRNLQTEASPSSGDMHLILGPMFAGKTTRLLSRIQSGSRSGSFQVGHRKNNLHLDKTLKGLCVTGRLSEAVGLLCRTRSKVELETYALLLQECINRKEYKMGRRIHAQMITVGFVPNEYLKTKLLILYAKSGILDTAQIIFVNLLEKGLIPWNAMIAGYVQKGLEELGLDMYYGMRQNGLMPDQYTFASVFRACAALATLEHGTRAHAVMIKCNIKNNVVVDSAVVDMYFKCSCLSEGHKFFDKLSSRNVITWTSLISGYGHNGKVAEVLESFNKLKNEGLRPNYVTFLAVLCACSHGGLVDEGWEYFKSMERDYEIEPKGKHYAAMVDLLGRAGRLQEAYEFILNAPCKEHSVIWGALLGACRVHGNLDLLELSARKYFELEQENAGKYVVLANAYASFGFWDAVAEIRVNMKNSRLVKEPGYSKIEVQGEVHHFLKGGKSHQHSERIYEMIQWITCVLRDVGYDQDFGHV